MSTGVSSEHQRSKGQGNSGKSYNKFPNGPKDHHGEREHEESVESWRNQQQQQQQPPQHHQGYAQGSMAAASDPYMSSYYGASFQYQTAFGVGEGGAGQGPWSNGGDMFLTGGGYSAGMHDASGASAHYNIDGMFGGGNGGISNFSGQPGFGYGFQDYNTWGQPQPRKHYDDYYRDNMYGDERGVKMVEQGMGGLSLGNDKEHGLKDLKEMMQQQGGGGGGGKKTTWASIASQPAKPQSLMKKKPGMPPPPIIPGTWENKNGTVPKAPIAAPVQAPRPPKAWERPKVPPPQSMPPPPQQPPQSGMERGGPGPGGMGQGPPPSHHHQRGYQNHQNHHGQPPMNYMSSQPHPPPPAMMQQQHSQKSHSHPPPPPPPQSNNNHVPAPPAQTQPAQPQYPDELKMKNEYNPPHFDLSPEGARFFVIKSYSEDDIHRSIKYEIWCSTEHGNNRLDQAFREREGKGPIYLFFSVNGSGHFCGMAQMVSPVDYEASASVWCQDKWKGQFKVKWIYVKDVQNSALRHIKLENNENKPVTNSRDTQEVPYEKGKQVLQILHTYAHTTSIFDDFIHYEKREEVLFGGRERNDSRGEEEDRRPQHQPASAHSTNNSNNNHHDRGDRGGGRGHHHGGHSGGYQGRGGDHHHSYNNHRDNPRGGDRGDPRDHRDRDGGGYHGRGGMDRNDHHRGPPPDRDQYDRGNSGRSYDRGDRGDREFHPRGDFRGGRGGGGRGRN